MVNVDSNIIYILRGVLQSLVEKHFPAPDRNRIKKLLGNVGIELKQSKVQNGDSQGPSSSGGTGEKRKSGIYYYYYYSVGSLIAVNFMTLVLKTTLCLRYTFNQVCIYLVQTRSVVGSQLVPMGEAHLRSSPCVAASMRGSHNFIIESIYVHII